MGDEQWFSFSEDTGFQRHDSAEEARACAQRALDYDTSEAGCDGWPDSTGRICWGEVREAAVETVTHAHGPDCRPDSSDDDDDDACTEGYSLQFERICDFNLTPTQASEIDALRARAEAAEQRAEAAEADAGATRAAAARERDRMRGNVDAWQARTETAEQRAEALAAELEQARADRALLAGLWLIVVHHDVLPALLPTDQGDRDRLAAALDAVDRQIGAEARIAAGRAVIARIVAEMGGGAA